MFFINQLGNHPLLIFLAHAQLLICELTSDQVQTVLRRILGKSFWSSCVRFTFAYFLTNSKPTVDPLYWYIHVWCPRVGYFNLPMICLKWLSLDGWNFDPEASESYGLYDLGHYAHKYGSHTLPDQSKSILREPCGLCSYTNAHSHLFTNKDHGKNLHVCATEMGTHLFWIVPTCQHTDPQS